MIKQLSDIELVEKALRGERSGYAALVNRHKTYAFSIALRIVKNKEEAEEVTQDSFLKAFRALGQFRHEAKFSTWLYRIVYTTALNYLRRYCPETVELDSQLSDQLPSYQPDSADLLDQKIKKKYLDLAFSKLKAEDAIILQLFYIDEKSLDEIATIMDLETNTVKIRLHRARPRLRLCLESIMNNESIAV